MGTAFIQDWLTKPGYGMPFLSQFEIIHTSSPASQVKYVRDYAKAHGYADWANKVKIDYRDCPSVTGRTCPGYISSKWEKQYAVEGNPGTMAFLAVHYNKLLGCDWFFYGTKGIPIEIWNQFKSCNANNVGETICWGPDKYQCDGTQWNRISQCDASCTAKGSAAINTTQDCPKGLWDGNIEIDGKIYNIGDTRGKTFLEWLAGPALNYIRTTLWYEQFQGYHCEDYPSPWIYVSQDWIYGNPDPDYVTNPGSGPHPNGLNYNQIAAYGRNYWDTWFFRGFLRGMRNDGKTLRFNGNELRYMWSSYCQTDHGNTHCNEPVCWTYNPNNPPSMSGSSEMICKEIMQGCKNEHFLKWGGWPGFCKPVWMLVYKLENTQFRPVGVQWEGWDNTVNEMRPKLSAIETERIKNRRLGLAITLMGNGTCDIYGYEEDQFFQHFLREGHPEYAPESIPEVNIKLGYPLGSSQEHAYTSGRPPVYYRKFYNPDDDKIRTVVCNVHYSQYLQIGNPPITLPAYDGIWFEGDWNPI
jgi:hypothetical protein